MNCISSISYGFELVSPTRSVKAMRWLCCEPKQEELISNRSLRPSKAVTWKRRNAPGVNSSGEFGRLADYCIHKCLINTSFSCMFGKLAITKKEKSVVVLELKQLSLTALSTLYLMCSVLFFAPASSHLPRSPLRHSDNRSFRMKVSIMERNEPVICTLVLWKFTWQWSSPSSREWTLRPPLVFRFAKGSSSAAS